MHALCHVCPPVTYTPNACPQLCISPAMHTTSPCHACPHHTCPLPCTTIHNTPTDRRDRFPLPHMPPPPPQKCDRVLMPNFEKALGFIISDYCHPQITDISDATLNVKSLHSYDPRFHLCSEVVDCTLGKMNTVLYLVLLSHSTVQFLQG